MSEIAKLLRLGAPADKEIASQQMTVGALVTGEVFTTALTTAYARKKIIFFNATDAASGEIFLGPSGVTPSTGTAIEKAKWMEIQIAKDLDFYLVTDTANNLLHVLELA
jgi:hypothetical protein